MKQQSNYTLPMLFTHKEPTQLDLLPIQIFSDDFRMNTVILSCQTKAKKYGSITLYNDQWLINICAKSSSTAMSPAQI